MKRILTHVYTSQILELCPVNYNSSNGLMPCRPCPKGTYQPTPGQVECLTCTSEDDDLLCSEGQPQRWLYHYYFHLSNCESRSMYKA